MRPHSGALTNLYVGSVRHFQSGILKTQRPKPSKSIKVQKEYPLIGGCGFPASFVALMQAVPSAGFVGVNRCLLGDASADERSGWLSEPKTAGTMRRHIHG